MTFGPNPSPAWNPVTPVISDHHFSDCQHQPRSSISVSGRTVRLIVTFVEQDSAGVRSVVGVTGFTSADVAVVAVGTRMVLRCQWLSLWHQPPPLLMN